eukprot:gene19505-23323_t
MERYDVLQKLGEGSYGCVYLVRERGDSDKKDWVLKETVLPGTKHERDQCLAECFVRNDNAGRPLLGIVLPYCNGGSLEDLIMKKKQQGARIPENMVLDWLAQISLGLEFLHFCKVLHRDIKPANVFLRGDDCMGCETSMSAQLGDFGLARVLDRTQAMANTVCGTPYTMSPELLKGVPYNHKSDVWALGCVAFEMMSLSLPFQANNMDMGDVALIMKNSLKMCVNKKMGKKKNGAASDPDTALPEGSILLAMDSFKKNNGPKADKVENLEMWLSQLRVEIEQQEKHF